MKLVTRSEWAARPARNSRPLRTPQGVAIHWVGVSVSGDPIKTTRGIQNYHQNNKKWWDVAYNELTGDGVRLEGRGWRNRSGANGSGWNNRNFAAICMLLGPGQEVTPGHIDAVRDSISSLRRVHKNATRIVGHRDLKKSTTCPGNEIAELVRSGAFEPGQPPPGEKPSPFPSSGYPLPTRTLRRGDRGDEVAWVQFQLVSRGIKVAIDGIYGPRTASGVSSYQRRTGLVPDGITGPITLSSLLGAAI